MVSSARYEDERWMSRTIKNRPVINRRLHPLVHFACLLLEDRAGSGLSVVCYRWWFKGQSAAGAELETNIMTADIPGLVLTD